MQAGSEHRFLTTLPFPGREAWASRCERIDPASVSPPTLLRRLVAEAARHRALIVDGSVGPRDLYLEPLAALAVRRRPGGARTPIVLVECQWKMSGSRIDRALTRLGLRALDGPRVAYCVLTEWERDRFPGTWGVGRERVFVTPYCHTLSDAELAAPTSTDGDVFAGGNSLRDYEPLVAAATRIDAGVTIATKLLDQPLPANVSAGPVPEGRFFELLRHARAVVVPLTGRDDRTAGQQTYLNAMALGKVAIVTDSPGVREYVEDGRTGLVVPPGDADALTDALRWALDPANAAAVEQMAAAAREVARTRFSPERYVETLLSVAERCAARS
jgi:hypothetical protein